MTAVSTRAFILAVMRAGFPSFAFFVSRSIMSRTQRW
jgi:hypothetical protein